MRLRSAATSTEDDEDTHAPSLEGTRASERASRRGGDTAKSALKVEREEKKEHKSH